MFILNRPARMIGAGIGFAKEYNADRKTQKAANEIPGQGAIHEDEKDEDNGHEWAQAMDEAQSEAHHQASNIDGSQTEDDFLANLVERYPPPPPPPPYHQQQPVGKLPLPVILPQRRPHARTRGWVRGYAPVLADAGVDQTAWFEFLDQFEKSINKNNVFWAANLAVWITDKAYIASTGNIWVAPVVWAIHASIETGRRGYLHKKHNELLDKMNDQYFKPRGLYALIVEYNPKKMNKLGGWVDVRTNVTESVISRDDPKRDGWDNLLKGSADTIASDDQIPEFAPLIFPFFDDKNEKQNQSAFKHFQNFRQEYADRGASAAYQAQNPESKLADVAPQKEYASRFSNPNHPARQGVIGLVTGGKVNPRKGIIRGHGGKNDEAAAAADELTARNSAMHGNAAASSHSDNIVSDGANKEQIAWQAARKKGPRGMRRLLRQDMLYLMVVNMPSEAEIRGAYQQMRIG